MQAQTEHWVELRVHGVSGAPAEDMLDSAHVLQVAGDEYSRFFRPCDAQRNPVRPAPDHVLEGYHWGKYTSGSWRQALWLAILPFGVVNAAQFMLPCPTTRRARAAHALCGAMLRLLGLGLTAMLLLSVAVVAIDLTAWQWGPTHNLPDWRAMPGWPLALSMLACLGVLLLLFSFGRRFAGTGQSRDESTRRSQGRSPGSLDERRAPGDPPTELGRSEFFLGDTDAPALRRLHLATGLALIALLGAAAADRGGGRNAFGDWVFGTAAVLLVVVALTVLVLGDPEQSVSMHLTGRVERRRVWWHSWVAGLARVLVGIAAVDLLLACWLAGRTTVTPRMSRRALPGIDGVASGVLLACVAAMLGLLVANWVLASATRTAGLQARPAAFARFAAGMMPTLTATIGTFIGVGYSAAMPFGWAWFLDRGEGQGYEISPLLQRTAYAWGLTFLLVVAFGAAAGISFLATRTAFQDAARRAFTFGTVTEPRLPASWLPRVATAMWLARLKNNLETALWTFSLFGLGLSLAAAAEFFRYGESGRVSGDLPGPLGLLSEEPTGGTPAVLIALGTVVLIALAAGLVLLGRGAIRQESLRRGVNVGWDVMSFWPRAVHPFVPPPYSQRAVADLRDRISWHLAGDADPARPRPRASSVVVAAHSQGSLIAVAALLWLPSEERARVSLLTFGSQLKVLFPRGFPAYVNFDVLTWVFREYGERWLNLYRDTDAIAGPVLSWNHNAVSGGPTPQSRRIDSYDSRQTDLIDAVTGARICGNEWRLLDPTPHDPAFQTGAVAGVCAHGGYWRDPDWPNALTMVRPAVQPAPWATDAALPEPRLPGSDGLQRLLRDEQSDGQALEQLADRPAAPVVPGTRQGVGPRTAG